MIFDYNEIIEDIFKRNNNLKVLGKRNKKYKEFKKNKLNLKYEYVNRFTKDSFKNEYIKNICKERKNKILSFCIDTEANYHNVPTIIISRKVFRNKEKVKYVILLIVTLPKFRSYGFGNAAIYDYFNYINDNKRKVEIVLHSLLESEKFYLNLGFVRIKKSLFLERLEGLNDDDDKILLKYVI